MSFITFSGAVSVCVGKCPSSQLFFDEEDQPKVTESQIGTVGGMGQELDALLRYEGHSDLDFVGIAQLWNPFFFFKAQLMTSHF